VSYLFYTYLALFSLGCILMIISEILSDPCERDPLGETLLDLVSLGVLLAGMLFLTFGVSGAMLRSIWMFAAPIAVTLQMLLAIRARTREAERHDQTERRPSFLFPDLGTLAMTLPALAFNLCFAFDVGPFRQAPGD
jgi:hypothetical protein